MRSKRTGAVPAESTDPSDLWSGTIVSMIGDAPFETTVYKLGDKHYAARSNEFGFANYELTPVPAQLGTEVQFNLTK